MIHLIMGLNTNKPSFANSSLHSTTHQTSATVYIIEDQKLHIAKMYYQRKRATIRTDIHNEEAIYCT